MYTVDDYYDDYYNETNPLKRLEIFKALSENGLKGEERAAMERIFAKRYKNPGQDGEIDFFIRGYLITMTYAGTIGALLRGGAKKIGAEIMRGLLLDKAASSETQGHLYREFRNCALRYYNVSVHDLRYRSKLFGVLKLSDAETDLKFRKEIKNLREKAVKNLRLENELELFVSAFESVFADILKGDRPV